MCFLLISDGLINLYMEKKKLWYFFSFHGSVPTHATPYPEIRIFCGEEGSAIPERTECVCQKESKNTARKVCIGGCIGVACEIEKLGRCNSAGMEPCSGSLRSSCVPITKFSYKFSFMA